MDLSDRRWTVSAVLSLVAAVLLAFAAFLPLFTSDSDITVPGQAPIEVTVTGWSNWFSHGYQQLFGAVLALTAGLFAGLRRKGSLVLLVISVAFNLGAASMVGSTLMSYFTLYPGYSGPEALIAGDLGIGVWFLNAGLLAALAAVIVVLPKAQADHANSRWATSAALSLTAAVLLMAAAFLPHFQTGWGTMGDTGEITATPWNVQVTYGPAPGVVMPYSGGLGIVTSGYQQLFGAALALAAGLLALIAARKPARGRTGGVVLLVATGAFNVGMTSLLLALLILYFRLFPPASGSGLRLFELGLGSWCLFLGVLFALLATMAVLFRKPAQETVSSTAET
ncbi:hypothetical protein [Kibdelosporangium aridum]|uniref:hypothetical protein n=1 Tax=Kibdelosporangium aridum TaxID=2030 RepID=UPI0005273202